MSIFISGANGYIGGAILRAALAQPGVVYGGTRQATPLLERVVPFTTGDLAARQPQLPAVDVVIHAAGLGHRRGVAPEVWHRANVDAAANLARAARAAGARQFVLISTAHVHGRVAAGMVTDTTAPNPMDGYAASKLAAEDAVREAFGAPVTIIRPVAVIGPHCPGNLQLLMKCLVRRVPLPLAAIQNQRSFIHRDDLAQLVLLAAAAPPQTVLAAHPAAISTPDLLRALAAGLGLAPHLWPAPLSLLGLAASLAGRGAMWQSLAGSFIAAPRAAQAMGWEPAQTLAESLTETARYYHTTRQTA